VRLFALTVFGASCARSAAGGSSTVVVLSDVVDATALRMP
jgi:hypothetical protein